MVLELWGKKQLHQQEERWEAMRKVTRRRSQTCVTEGRLRPDCPHV